MDLERLLDIYNIPGVRLVRQPDSRIYMGSAHGATTRITRGTEVRGR
jgi:hypothetical protein